MSSLRRVVHVDGQWKNYVGSTPLIPNSKILACSNLTVRRDLMAVAEMELVAGAVFVSLYTRTFAPGALLITNCDEMVASAENIKNTNK